MFSEQWFVEYYNISLHLYETDIYLRSLSEYFLHKINHLLQLLYNAMNTLDWQKTVLNKQLLFCK